MRACSLWITASIIRQTKNQRHGLSNSTLVLQNKEKQVIRIEGKERHGLGEQQSFVTTHRLHSQMPDVSQHS